MQRKNQHKHENVKSACVPGNKHASWIQLKPNIHTNACIRYALKRVETDRKNRDF